MNKLSAVLKNDIADGVILIVLFLSLTSHTMRVIAEKELESLEN